MTDETHDPDTSTEDQIGDLEINSGGDIPVAEAAAPDAPPAAAGPRTFPQHYTLLMGGVFVFAASQADWERAHVFGQTTNGTGMAHGTFLMALSIYVVLVAILNILHGRLKGHAVRVHHGRRRAVPRHQEVLRHDRPGRVPEPRRHPRQVQGGRDRPGRLEDVDRPVRSRACSSPSWVAR